MVSRFVHIGAQDGRAMDGTSVTMYRAGGTFGVCGHSYEYADDGACSFWEFARRREVERALVEAGLDDIALQGEFCAPGIQRKPLKLVTPAWYVFTIVDLASRRRLSLGKMQETCDRLGLPAVSVEETGESFAYPDVDALLERARGTYASGIAKEGIVVRPMEPTYSQTLGAPLSMKAINNDYLLKRG